MSILDDVSTPPPAAPDDASIFLRTSELKLFGSKVRRMNDFATRIAAQ
jgi:hypothetical protein